MNRVKWIAFAAFAVIAVGLLIWFGQKTMPGAVDAPKRVAEAAAAKASAPVCARNPYFAKTPLLGEWQRLDAAASEGGALFFFNPFSMTCDESTGYRDVSLEIRYSASRTEDFEDETTIESVSFSRERYLYRIDCAGDRFQVLERSIMDDAGETPRRTAPVSDGAEANMKPIRAGGVAAILAGPACSSGKL